VCGGGSFRFSFLETWNEILIKKNSNLEIKDEITKSTYVSCYHCTFQRSQCVWNWFYDHPHFSQLRSWHGEQHFGLRIEPSQNVSFPERVLQCQMHRKMPTLSHPHFKSFAVMIFPYSLSFICYELFCGNRFLSSNYCWIKCIAQMKTKFAATLQITHDIFTWECIHRQGWTSESKAQSVFYQFKLLIKNSLSFDPRCPADEGWPTPIPTFLMIWNRK